MSAPFYRDKYKIERKKIVNYWYELTEFSTSEKLRKYIIENGITYIMFPYGPEYPYSPNISILEYLYENRDNEFKEVVKFNLGENFILVYTMPLNISGNCCSGRAHTGKKNGEKRAGITTEIECSLNKNIS
jgi:hypothetical protein